MKKFVFFSFLLLSIVFCATCVWAADIEIEKNPGLIGAVIVEGSTAFDRRQILTAYFDLIGNQSSAENLDSIRQRITAFYAENNYYRPEVTIQPDPSLKNVFRFAINEPLLVSFDVSGGNSKTQAEANAYLNSLLGGTVNSAPMFQFLQQALHKHLQVGVVVVPVHAANTRKDFHADIELTGDINSNVTVSNEGSDRLGKEILSAEVRLAETVPGFREVYFNTFNTVSTHGFRSFGAGAIIDAGVRNSFITDLNLSLARLDNNNGQAEIEFHKQNLSLAWQFSLSDEPTRSSGISTSLSARDFQQEQIIEDINEKLRLFELGYWHYSLGQSYSLNWGFSLGQGLDALGAELTGPLADPTIDIDFSKINARMTWQYLLPKDISLRIDAQGQYSDDNLPFSQRFAIASNTTARAYESGELNGDSGMGVKLELRKGFESSLLSSTYIPYIYYGVGKVKDNLLNDSITGASVGLGVRLRSQSYSAYLETGKPLINDSIYRTSTPRTQAGFSYYF